MPKGGYRPGAGGKPAWKHGKTTTIRVPIVFAKKILEIARKLDNEEFIELNIDSVTNSNIDNPSGLDVGNIVSFPSQQTKIEDLPLPEASVTNYMSICIPDEDELEKMSRKLGLDGLYYITHFENVVSILKRGILSHAFVESNNITYTPIYNSSVVNRRADKIVKCGKSLWDYANLYFQPRNAMLYSLKAQRNEIAIICIKVSILDRADIFITTGNAANRESQILPIKEGRKILPEIRNQIDREWWKLEDGSKRKIMAECLIPDSVPPDYIHTIYVASDKARKLLEYVLKESEEKNIPNVPIVVEPKKFFQPDWRGALNDKLFLVKGDMFFSTMQTLTISVNCVGVMGKGLASTAKYRFPDMYVKYEDLCKNKSLQMGRPYVYKRESSVSNDLADESFYLEGESSSQTWFLLFPTKNHWKNKADINGIEEGLRWLLGNYKKCGIESLAMPALGCGLGQLEWREIGPLMCKYLAEMNIPVAIYLPADREITEELTSREFLLSQVEPF